MSYLNLPNPCLSAILLTVSTHSGPQFVFNYPPVPSTTDTSLLKDRESELLSDSESDSDWSYASDEGNQSEIEKSNEEVFEDSEGEGGLDSYTGTAPEPQYRGMPGSLLERLERRGGNRRRRHHGSVAGQGSRRGSNGSASGIGIGGGNKKLKSKSRDNTDSTVNGTNIPDSDDLDITKVAGFDTDFLSELLCPQRAMCNMKFEMCVDDTVFLGLPIHIQADGQWRRKKSNRKTSYSVQSTLKNGGKSVSGKTASKRNSVDYSMRDGQNSVSNSGIINDNENDADDDADKMDGTESASASGSESASSSDEDTKPTSNHKIEDLTASISSIPEFSDPQSPMRMFHITFVMTPPITEYKFRVDQMYHFVLTNFVKTLRTEQARSNYVWNEVMTMLKIRDSALSELIDNGNRENKKKLPSPYELCDEMIQKSSLALAIAQLFNAIDTSDIANLRINNKLRSFQIPIEYEFSRLPAITEPYLSRSYLSSISDFDNNNMNELGGAGGKKSSGGNAIPTEFNVYCTILLLDSPDRIIKDIGVDPYSPLANFIRDINPTVTIQTLAATSGVEVNHVIELMRSLVYWRKARPIAPLHHRNTYAVSPLASIGQIYKYIPMFKEQFPALPSLPRMLSMLSTGRPRSFAFHIPSRDHRDVYLNALAWLFKYGFVMQLRTFVWLRITKKIKMAVNRDIQNEEQIRETKREVDPVGNIGNEGENVSDFKNTDTSTDNTSKRDSANTTSLSEGMTGITITDTSTPTTSSPNLMNLNNTVNHVNGLAGKFSTSSSHSDMSEYSSYAEDWKQDTILLDPTTATLLQKKWIAKITENKPPELVTLFNRLVKHFNGHSPMENVMLVENLPRQDLRKLLTAFDEFLIVVRHW